MIDLRDEKNPVVIVSSGHTSDGVVWMVTRDGDKFKLNTHTVGSEEQK